MKKKLRNPASAIMMTHIEPRSAMSNAWECGLRECKPTHQTTWKPDNQKVGCTQKALSFFKNLIMSGIFRPRVLPIYFAVAVAYVFVESKQHSLAERRMCTKPIPRHYKNTLPRPSHFCQADSEIPVASERACIRKAFHSNVLAQTRDSNSVQKAHWAS